MNNIDIFVNNVSEQYKGLENFRRTVNNKVSELKSLFLTVSVENKLTKDDPFEIKWNIPDNFSDFLKETLEKNSEVYKKNDTYWKLDGTIHTRNTLESLCTIGNNEYYSDKWRLIATENEFDILLATMGYNNISNAIKSKYLELNPVCDIKSIKLNTAINPHNVIPSSPLTTPYILTSPVTPIAPVTTSNVQTYTIIPEAPSYTNVSMIPTQTLYKSASNTATIKRFPFGS